MTPAQEAKNYASLHGFNIVANERRYDVLLGGDLVANVGGYAAALNAMVKRVEEGAHIDALQTFVEQGQGDLQAMADAVFKEVSDETFDAILTENNKRIAQATGLSVEQLQGQQPAPVGFAVSEQITNDMLEQYKRMDGESKLAWKIRVNGRYGKFGQTGGTTRLVTPPNVLSYGSYKQPNGDIVCIDRHGPITVRDGVTGQTFAAILDGQTGRILRGKPAETFEQRAAETKPHWAFTSRFADWSVAVTTYHHSRADAIKVGRRLMSGLSRAARPTYVCVSKVA